MIELQYLETASAARAELAGYAVPAGVLFDVDRFADEAGGNRADTSEGSIHGIQRLADTLSPGKWLAVWYEAQA